MGAVFFGKACDEVPAAVRKDRLSRLQEIGASLAVLPRSSAVWDSIAQSGLLIEVGGWRFHYRVDDGGEKIVVQAALHIGK